MSVLVNSLLSCYDNNRVFSETVETKRISQHDTVKMEILHGSFFTALRESQ